MYKLFIANKNYSSWSLRPWILMRQLGISFEENLVTFSEGSNWHKFREFCPTGKVPCLLDGDQLVWDSLAITEYLAEQHTEVWPKNKSHRAWARCASAEMHSGFEALREFCSMNIGVRVRLNQISPALQKDLDRIDELWCEGLKGFGGDFLAGSQFTAVDAFFVPVVFRLQTYALPMSELASAYCQRILSLESCKAWQTMALQESWRETSHENDVVNAGEVIVDLRRQ